jgi:hypothetical protein
MAIIQPDFGDHGEDRATAGAVGADSAEFERKLLNDGQQVIAYGSLICSECELPLPGRPTVSAGSMLHCGWCGHAARARELFRANVLDAPANGVALVARLSAEALDR